MQKFLRRLERFSQSLLSPLSYLSAAGLLLVLGALLTSKPLVSGAAGAAVGSAAADRAAALQRDDGAHQQPQRHSLRGGGCRARKTEKQDAALLALMAYLVFLTANHTALEALGLLCPAERDDRPCGHGPDHHSGHSGGGHRRGKRHRAGLCGGVALQPHLRKAVLWHDHPALFGPAVVVLWLSALAVALGLGFCFVCPPLQRAVSAPSRAGSRLQGTRVCSFTAFWNGCSSPPACITSSICPSSSLRWAAA